MDETQGMPLIAMLIQSNYDDYASMAKKINDDLARENRHLKAELSLVTDNIERLCSGDYAPSTVALLRALYPTEGQVKARAKELFRA